MSAVRAPAIALLLATLQGAALAQGTPQISLSGVAGIGTTVQIQLSDAPNHDRPYVAALSLGTAPGIPVGAGAVVPLNWDTLFDLSIAAPGLLGLSGMQGILGPSGTASIYWDIPNVPALVGYTVYAAYVTINPVSGQLASISPALQVTFTLPPPPPPPPTPVTPVLNPALDLPGVVITILQLTGGTAANGNFRPGDTMTVRFKIAKKDGSALTVPDVNSLRIQIAGPTFNYQRVIAQLSDVRNRAVAQADGSYLYTFPSAIPATYIAPLNDTAFYGPGDGELTGQALYNGTYTVGMEGYKTYSVEGTDIRDSGNATRNFLIGNGSFMLNREVVKMENCNACHTELSAHGRNRKDLTTCLLCHTSGSEDRNTATVANGTPGVSIDFRVMIHKIHNGKHLPSVLGVGTDANGSRNYAATPQPYEIMGNGNSIHDFSEIGFPVWPNLNIPMPRDQGFSALTAAQQAAEDQIRMGVTDCDKCHGDPDGAGPVAAPAQGANLWQKPSRRACGACHDDIDWTHTYSANGQTMPACYDDDSCLTCHPQSGPLSAIDGHLHPLKNTAVNPGLNVNVLSVDEAGNANGNGRLDPGEKVRVTLTLTDGAGQPVAPSVAGSSLSLYLAGPTWNRQMVLYHSIPTAALTGSQPYSVLLPELLFYEPVGMSTGCLDVFNTARTSVWSMSGATITLQVRTATGAVTTTTAAAPRFQNFLDVADATGFLRNDMIVVDDAVPGVREYMRIQTVQGNRLWFASAGNTSYKPALASDHASGATVTKVTLAGKTIGTDFSVNAQTGLIQEITEFGAGREVVLTYNTDFVMPAFYGMPINGTPDLGEAQGDWTGKPLESGTYTVGLWGARTISLALLGETNSYRGTAPAGTKDFLVGSASTIQPGAIISSAANCNACHNDLYFHGGGRRGYEACILCHGAAGSEDRPQYVAANAPPTTGLSIEFREMLHKIHKGKELENAATYAIVGHSSAAYPNNFGTSTYEEVGFPSMPDGVKNCRSCHGATSTSWMVPADRDHGTAQGQPVLEWRFVCSSCHDGALELTHFQSNTAPNGAEACAMCHGNGGSWNVPLMHKVR